MELKEVRHFLLGCWECCHKLGGSEQSEREEAFQMNIDRTKAFENRFVILFILTFLASLWLVPFLLS